MDALIFIRNNGAYSGMTYCSLMGNWFRRDGKIVSCSFRCIVANSPEKYDFDEQLDIVNHVCKRNTLSKTFDRDEYSICIGMPLFF